MIGGSGMLGVVVIGGVFVSLCLSSCLCNVVSVGVGGIFSLLCSIICSWLNMSSVLVMLFLCVSVFISRLWLVLW